VLCARYRLPRKNGPLRTIELRTRDVAGRSMVRLRIAQHAEAPFPRTITRPNCRRSMCGCCHVTSGSEEHCCFTWNARKPRATRACDIESTRLSENLRAAIRIRRSRALPPWIRTVDQPGRWSVAIRSVRPALASAGVQAHHHMVSVLSDSEDPTQSRHAPRRVVHAALIRSGSLNPWGTASHRRRRVEMADRARSTTFEQPRSHHPEDARRQRRSST
jgi:hypothetical protein